MPAPVAALDQGGGPPPRPNPQPPSGARTYSNVAASSAPRPLPRLTHVPLANRPPLYVDNTPLVIFIPNEVEQLNKQRENTLIIKFSLGCPRLHEIRQHIVSEWNLSSPPAIGAIDPRHATIHMASFADTQCALSHDKNKIKSSLFRLFRWSLSFAIGKESSMVAIWVKFHNLPLQYFNESSLIRLGSVLGTVLRICPLTMNLTQQSYARMCIEIDVSKPLMETFLMGTSKDSSWSLELEYESNNAFCTHCGLLGHREGLCRKKGNRKDPMTSLKRLPMMSLRR